MFAFFEEVVEAPDFFDTTLVTIVEEGAREIDFYPFFSEVEFFQEMVLVCLHFP